MKKLIKTDAISHIVLLVALFTAVAVIILVHYNEYKNITKSITRTSATQDLDKKVTTLKLGVQQMIINRRGYSLLGDAKYRKKFMSFYESLDEHIIDISKSFNDDESDTLIKSVNSKVSELKAYLKARVDERDKGLTDHGDNVVLYALYDSISEDLEQLSWMLWSRYQKDLKDTQDAYNNYSSSILISSLVSIVIFSVLGAMLIYSQRKTNKTQSELGDANKRLNILLQATSDGILDWDLKNNNLMISPKFKNLLGYEDDEIKSDFDSIFDLIHPEDKLSTWLYARKIITPENPVFNQIFRMKHKDGSWAWISAKGIGFFDEHNQLERFVGVHTDVTLQKNLETLLKYSKDQAEIEGQQKSDFLAYMSHEIRSPLSAVVGLTKLLSETSPLTEDQKKYLSALRSGADTVYGLLNNILDLSKISANAAKLEKTEFNLNQVVNDTISLASFPARQKNIKLNSNISPEANGNFWGDPYRIKQIINNLLNNAIKFTESGSVTLSVKIVPDFGSKDIKAEISVHDTGIGIPKDKLVSIFDPYIQSTDDITRKYGGTGLGLAICKQFVEMMGGKIEVESDIGQGSTFKVYIPLEKNPKLTSVPGKKAAKADKLEKPAVITQNTILLVEDYAPNAMVAETVIKNLGYSCVSVDTAKEALLKLSSKAGNNIGIILMDVNLPDMNGFETTKLIRRLEQDNSRPPRKIIAMTAHNLIGDKEKCIAVGMDDYISKPFTPEELAEKLGQPFKMKVVV